MSDLTDDAMDGLVSDCKSAAEVLQYSGTFETGQSLLEQAATVITALRQREAEAINRLGPIADLLPDAVSAAEKAMQRYPQPNYVISKWAEETGEVTKDLIHMAEGRQTADKVRGEMVQALAMLHRLLVEGDQVHGLPPVAAAILAAADKLEGKP